MVIFQLLTILTPLFVFAMFAFVIATFISPKFRGKIMSNQIKATKYMTDYAKEDMKDIATNMGDVTFDSANEILKNNMGNLEEIADNTINLADNVLKNNSNALKRMANQSAQVLREPLKETVSAIKEGLSDEPQIYCKHCGASIDADSTFCKVCGKQQ